MCPHPESKYWLATQNERMAILILEAIHTYNIRAKKGEHGKNAHQAVVGHSGQTCVDTWTLGGQGKISKEEGSEIKVTLQSQLWTSLGYLRPKILSCLQPLFVPFFFTMDFIKGFFLTDSLHSLMVSSSVSSKSQLCQRGRDRQIPKKSLNSY